MEEELRFLRESIVEVDAAVVGISSTRWTAIPESEANPGNAAPIMKANRFDVLPIVVGFAVKEYFCADEWNTYTSISRKAITHRDVIPFDTRLRDVIRGFALDSRHFYFLNNNRKIIGLISVANLNCRAVKVYLFSLLAWLTDKSEACPSTLLRSVYTLFGETVCQGGSPWRAHLVCMIRW